MFSLRIDQMNVTDMNNYISELNNRNKEFIVLIYAVFQRFAYSKKIFILVFFTCGNILQKLNMKKIY